MKPGDRLVCALLEPLDVGQTFREWPLHVTLLPWFRVDDPSDRVAASLREAYTGIAPFTAVMGREVRLGPNKDRPARVLDPAGSFPELERLTRRYLHKKRAWLVDETTRVRRPYLPHVTYQPAQARPGRGAAVHCDRLHIIEQKGGYKQVAAHVPLTP